MTVADVYINIPVKSIAQEFTYILPETLSQVTIGWRVFVPFGNVRKEGFVTCVRPYDPTRDGGHALKEIIEAVDEEAWFSPQLLAAAQELAAFYLCSAAEIMRLFMPGKSGLRIFPVYRVAEDADAAHPLLADAHAHAVYCYLSENGARRMTELRRALPEAAVDEYIEKLLRYHLVCREYRADKRDKALYEKYYTAVAITDELLVGLARKPAQARALLLFRECEEYARAELDEKGISPTTIKNLVAAGLLTEHLRRRLRNPYGTGAGAARADELTQAQHAAVTALQEGIAAETFHGYLLHGVTGSGKTRVYIETARAVRARGRQVVVLVPEIALTGQLITAFQEVFADDIVVLHSQLSLAERNDSIFRVRRGDAGIIIGARSALFTPANDVGAIILDEEQDMSYKQDESPRYHARVVAEILARRHGAILVLGSATPSLESYARAQAGDLTLLTLPERIGSQPLPQVRAVDMREELRRGRRTIISLALRELLTETLARHEQAIIMLNRRGYSTFIMCRSCGAVITCADCGLPLVYHANGALVCHHCDLRAAVPETCPKCGSRYIKYFGSGTEKLEEELGQLLPAARLVRMDRDTTGRKFAHTEILTQFRRRNFDILLGTQMVAKGHDLPGVQSVGIISADASLNLPDFRAAERCFMLITQTAGRAGRHGARGAVIVQTYNPEHYAVRAALRQDYEAFAAQELVLRRELFYPPYSRLVKLLFRDPQRARAWNAANEFVAAAQTAFTGTTGCTVIGPSPALIERERGTYRFIVLIKTDALAVIQNFLRTRGLHLRDDVAIDIDPTAIF
ncbi:primosomal protein N' [Selenomonas sp. oral taxon 138]|uniref:replication restart helicase PriA n=1 Tax=Selenomonas sp. oral taxon 138 TaxID=712532 RepID=UPI0002A46D38|nr:primosomal protein N' [Selenomonas sp. oral taxon 138]EKY01689.1 primosomal protein [Selenomonas sp. oral taxon 138 str. F0429]